VRDFAEANQRFAAVALYLPCVDHLLLLIDFVPQSIDVRIDKERLRPVDIPVLQGNATKLQEETGWAPTYNFQQTLEDVLDDCRARVRAGIA